MYSFKSLKEPKHTTSGIADRFLFALTDWFVPGGIKYPGAWVNYGDGVTIFESHEFKPGFGFLSISLAPEKNSYDAKTIGDKGFQKFANEVKVMVPGSYASLHEEIFNLIGKPVIVLIKDSDCPADIWYQVGTDCVAARIAADFATGTTKEGNKGYELTITNTAEKVLFYKGDITYPGEVEGLVARLTGTKVGSTVNLDATTSTVNGTVTYEYIVLYNDGAGTPQSVTLPDTGNTASFDTSILTGWNGVGLAVELIIDNGLTQDVTRSADSQYEKPLILGSVDEGFSDGFDFNVTIT